MTDLFVFTEDASIHFMPARLDRVLENDNSSVFSEEDVFTHFMPSRLNRTLEGNNALIPPFQEDPFINYMLPLPVVPIKKKLLELIPITALGASPAFPDNYLPKMASMFSPENMDILLIDDLNFPLRGRLGGNVTDTGEPVERRLALYHKNTKKKIAETVSDINGDYQFDVDLNPNTDYFIVCFPDDATRNTNALIKDWAIPEIT